MRGIFPGGPSKRCVKPRTLLPLRAAKLIGQSLLVPGGIAADPSTAWSLEQRSERFHGEPRARTCASARFSSRSRRSCARLVASMPNRDAMLSCRRRRGRRPLCGLRRPSVSAATSTLRAAPDATARRAGAHRRHRAVGGCRSSVPRRAVTAVGEKARSPDRVARVPIPPQTETSPVSSPTAAPSCGHYTPQPPRAGFFKVNPEHGCRWFRTVAYPQSQGPANARRRWLLLGSAREVRAVRRDVSTTMWVFLVHPPWCMCSVKPASLARASHRTLGQKPSSDGDDRQEQVACTDAPTRLRINVDARQADVQQHHIQRGRLHQRAPLPRRRHRSP